MRKKETMCIRHTSLYRIWDIALAADPFLGLHTGHFLAGAVFWTGPWTSRWPHSTGEAVGVRKGERCESGPTGAAQSKYQI